MTDRVITASELARNASAVLDEVAAGRTVLIHRRGHPVARLVPEPLAGRRLIGRMAGRGRQVVSDEELVVPIPDWDAV